MILIMVSLCLYHFFSPKDLKLTNSQSQEPNDICISLLHLWNVERSLVKSYKTDDSLYFSHVALQELSG